MIVAGGPRSTGSRAAYDAVIVGARCAGSPLAARLATSGWRVLLLDHKPPPANTISTHFVFPNTIARLAELGVLERIERRHRLNWCLHRVQILGHEIAGAFTPVAGYDRCLGLRRPVLDQALLDAAVDAGAETRFGGKVAGLSGSGRDGDPVTGVVLEGGERIEARWVIGADGGPRRSRGRSGSRSGRRSRASSGSSTPTGAGSRRPSTCTSSPTRIWRSTGGRARTTSRS